MLKLVDNINLAFTYTAQILNTKLSKNKIGNGLTFDNDGNLALVNSAHAVIYPFVKTNDINNWVNYSRTGEVDIVLGSLKIGNNSGNDQAWLIHKDLYPIDNGEIYKVTFRVKKELGSGTAYLGFAGVKEDKSTFANYKGDNSYGSQHYAVASVNLASEWTEYECYFAKSGVDLSQYQYKKNAHSTAKYLRLLALFNYSGRSGISWLDWVKVELI